MLSIAVIGAPLDLGAGRRDVDMGPSAIRVANLHARLASLAYEVNDLGNVEVKQAESVAPGAANARYLQEIALSCRRLADMVAKAAAAGSIPLVLGGDHSVAIGTVMQKINLKNKSMFLSAAFYDERISGDICILSMARHCNWFSSARRGILPKATLTSIRRLARPSGNPGTESTRSAGRGQIQCSSTHQLNEPS